jgi:hypothetical protein
MIGIIQNMIALFMTWASPDRLLAGELTRCGEIIDPHLHIAPWFNTAAPLIDELSLLEKDDLENMDTLLLELLARSLEATVRPRT